MCSKSSTYATLFICAILCDGTCSKFITFLHHVDVEGKQVQIECQVELYSIEKYTIIHQHSIKLIDCSSEFLVALVALQQSLPSEFTVKQSLTCILCTGSCTL